MISYRFHFTNLILSFFTLINLSAQPNSLPRSTPEAQGVSSKGIIEFLDAAAKSKNEFHSFMFLRHGKIIAEGWWNPYRPDLKHTLYSLSKSFTSSAVGFAVSEGKLKIADKVISFFPNDLPDSVGTYLKNLTVKDLLTMSVGQEPDPTFRLVPKDNWIKEFLATPILHEPGSVFLYNSMSTYMLSAIVQKVTGQKVIDYLRPRLFEPLGIKGMDWEVDLQNINTGGWGLRVKTEDMAKFGQFYLQKGKWKGKQLLPEWWIKEATSFKILQSPEIKGPKRDSSDWLQGYCYQFWRCRHDAFRGDGAFGQFIIVMPKQDAVIAITAETADMQNELNLVWDYLLPSIKNEGISPDLVAEKNLSNRLKKLSLPLYEYKTDGIKSHLIGKYSIDSNKNNIKTIDVSFQKEILQLNIKEGSSFYSLDFGAGKWVNEETKWPVPTLIFAKSKFKGLSPFKVAGNYHWIDSNTVQLKLRFIESPHSETFTLHIENNRLIMNTKISFNNSGYTVSGEKNN